MPFAGYEDFADCVKSNQDKDDPKGYCATIMRKVEGEKMDKKDMMDSKDMMMDDDEMKKKKKAMMKKKQMMDDDDMEEESIKTMKWIEAIQTEDIKVDDKILENSVSVKGTAIKARVSRNNVDYRMEELSKAKNSLIGRTISLDHSDRVEDVVGIIEKVTETPDGLDYQAKVFDTKAHPDITERLRNGLINHVSIEALPPKQLEEQNGVKVAKDIEFIGLAFVRHPGIPESSAMIAEALSKISDGMAMRESSHKIEEKGEVMSEEKIQEKAQEKVVESTAPSADITESLKKELQELKEEVKSLKEAPKSKGNLTEDVKSEVKGPILEFVRTKEGISCAPRDPRDWY